MSDVECISAFAQALNDNPHKSVLMKNALQAAQAAQAIDQSVLNLGSPKDAADSTHSIFSKSSRGSDLQPANDPFLVDNIFKSPKKRRRGLLSWSAAPADYPAVYGGDRTLSMSRELSRHSRIKQRRQSILGSKSRQPSLRRRQTNRSGHSEHIRSASDPTGRMSEGSPKSIASTLPQDTSPTIIPSEASSPEPQRCKKTQSLAVFPTRIHKKSPSSSASSLVSELPPLPDSCSSSASTLRGVGRARATPYISVSALRLVSNSSQDCVVTIRHPEQAKVRERPMSKRRSGIDLDVASDFVHLPGDKRQIGSECGSPFLPVVRSSKASSGQGSVTGSEGRRRERTDGWLSVWFSSFAVSVLRNVASCGIKAKH